jgi:hypothetical protein
MANNETNALGNCALLSLGPTQPPIRWVLGGPLSPGVKRPGREADNSTPISSEVENAWIYTTTSPCVFMGTGKTLFSTVPC